MLHAKQSTPCRFLILSMALVIGFTNYAEAASQVTDTNMGEMDAPASSSDITIQSASDSSHILPIKNVGSAMDDQEDLLELLAVLEEETAVATKTKMNNDYVPGMATVLHGDQLEALGVHTVAEALTLVPGIQLARITNGEPTVKVRGITFPFNAGNVKVMLNSMALSRESSGINSSVLLTPVEQIDRIEIIRGPGSSIYGNFAMAGVVNIITRNSNGRLYGRAGDDESKSGGGHYTYRDEEHAFGLGINVSATDDGENATIVDRDPDEERFTGVFNLDYKNFVFTAQGVQRAVDLDRLVRAPASEGPHQPSLPSVSGQKRTSQTEKSWAMEGRQTIELGRTANLEAYLSYLSNDLELEQRIFRGDRIEAGLDLNWSPWSRHQLLFGFSYTESAIDNAFDEGRPGEPHFEASGIDHRNYALGIQDQITLSERFSLTLGIRYDDYDDVGDHLTPRIAGVYRLGEHHVLKAQYSEGFRAPTFWELYRVGSTDGNLDFEVIKTTELAYVYRRPRAVGRVTLYSSRIDDGLFAEPTTGFDNYIEIESKGVEVEWEQQIGEKFRWQANISYNDTSDERWSSITNSGQSLGVADWLGNLAFFLEPLPKLMLTGRLLHIGDRHALGGWIDGYDSVDLTISRMDLLKKGLMLRAGVKNIFDDKTIHLTARPDSLTEDEFRARTFWLQVSYEF